MNPFIDNLHGLLKLCIIYVGSFIYNDKLIGVFGIEYAKGKSLYEGIKNNKVFCRYSEKCLTTLTNSFPYNDSWFGIY